MIKHCLFEDNDITSTSKIGGALLSDNSNCIIQNCSFINNSAEIAGALSIKGPRVTVVINCTFYNNYASNHSGVARVHVNATARFYHNTFFQNSANNYPDVLGSTSGTAVYLENNAIGDNGVNTQLFWRISNNLRRE